VAIAFRAAAVASQQLQTVTCAKPTGTADGDVLLAYVFNRETGYSIAVADGVAWNLVDQFDTTNLQGRVYWKYASSEPADYSFDLQDASSIRFCQVHIIAISGVTGGLSPIAASQEEVEGTGTSHSGPNLTAPAATMLVYHGAAMGSGARTVTNDSGTSRSTSAGGTNTSGMTCRVTETSTASANPSGITYTTTNLGLGMFTTAILESTASPAVARSQAIIIA
jgi:hypothetical protein